jgi:myosin heavy subunit
LTQEEVSDILEEFERQKQKKGANAGGSSEDLRRASLAAKVGVPNATIFIENDQCDLNNHENNESKPFYVAYFHKLDGDNAYATITPEEAEECKVVDLKKKNFPIHMRKTLEYSQRAEEGIADMVEIDELNSASLLYNLGNRYAKDEIYTYVGPILLVLNPFKAILGSTGPEQAAKYQQFITTQSPFQLKRQLQPHNYAIAALAYRNLRHDRNRQAIVISGESGAGKTEQAKIAMNFLTQMGTGGSDSAAPGSSIGDKILACNPVLEGFGNSKTVRNNNSSRFGKYVLMYFALYEDKVFGARIKNYLLEKSRVVKVAPMERGYHVFYFLLKGASDEMLRSLFLTKTDGSRFNWKDFRYLKTGGDLPDKHDVDGFNEIQDTLKQLQFPDA